MSARLRRLESDYKQILEEFSNHPHIKVTPIGNLPPEKYLVTYSLSGIYLKEDKSVENLKTHKVEIILHSDYPRYKPVVKILTPIFHPNFKDGQVCIGDIWGAGETLVDIIINIGNMIQYQSWNSYSPLSAEAASWAIKNKYMFPVGKIDLYNKDEEISENNNESTPLENIEINTSEDEIIITKEELRDIKFVPSAERMQALKYNPTLLDNKKLNFKTIVQKGLLWGLIGGVIGWALQEITDSIVSSDSILSYMGYTYTDLLYMDNIDHALSIVSTAVRISTGFFMAFVAGSIGALMGYGEGFYYGSKEKALRFAFRGLGIALGLGFVFGFIAQIMYSNLLTDSVSDFFDAFVRGIAWATGGLGIGLAIGLLKPEKKRIIYTTIGGTIGGFIGGSIFNSVAVVVTTSSSDTGIFPRFIGIVIMGILIGVGVGLLEQFAKSAWLKVVRGEFEGKEYLVFSGTTSIGNTGSNAIVLFKDKAVSEHHCEIKQEGAKYILYDLKSNNGTFVNGNRIDKQILSKGDAISVGDTILIFNVRED